MSHVGFFPHFPVGLGPRPICKKAVRPMLAIVIRPAHIDLGIGPICVVIGPMCLHDMYFNIYSVYAYNIMFVIMPTSILGLLSRPNTLNGVLSRPMCRPDFITSWTSQLYNNNNFSFQPEMVLLTSWL